MGTFRTIRRRTAPAWLTLGVTAAAVLTTASPAYAVDITLSAAAGPSGGGNRLTLTAAAAYGALDETQVFAQFQYKATPGATCADRYQTPVTPNGSAGVVSVVPNTIAQGGGVVSVAAGALTIVVPPTLQLAAGQSSADYNVCVYDDDQTAVPDAAIAATIAATPYRIVQRLTVSPQNGPAAGGNSLTLTAPAGFTPFVAGSFGVQLQAASPTANPTNYCEPTWAATVPVAATPAGVVPIPAADIGIVSSSKIVVPIPAAFATSLSLGFHVCVYEGIASTPANGDPLIDLIMGSGAPYTVGTPAEITSVTPSGGPAQGGNTIVVVGTGFGAGMTVSLAGAPLTPLSIQNNQFEAVMPPRAAGGPFKLSVTTAAGTVTTPTGVYTYSNGVKVEPNTAPNTKLTKTWVSVLGVGFQNLVITGSSTNGATPNSPGGHVYLVKGTYESRTATGAIAGTKANGQTTECVDVLVITDMELICGLYLAGNMPTPISRSFAGCNAVALNATTIASVANSACSFSPNDIGMTITSDAAGVPANTVITAVSSATSATISKPITTAIVASTPVFTLSSARTVTAATVSTTLNTVSATAATGPFTAADVGKRVTGTGIPVNTFIVSVTTGTATLSNTPTTGGTSVALSLFNPVPVGTYTITVVSSGAANAAAVEGYTQSIISSGSTFTVAEY